MCWHMSWVHIVDDTFDGLFQNNIIFVLSLYNILLC